MSSPQFTVYAHAGPNPWKVIIALEELGLSYTVKMVNSQAGDHKKAPYTDLNPNGRMPTLIDHGNNDFTIWESGAIILYLIEKYDTEHKLHFTKFEDEAIAKQYLMFQMSGQGPYFGQLFWFKVLHPEKIPSAIERYQNELKRVLTVLSATLKGKQYLVGDKYSYADFSFMPWLWLLDFPALELGDWKKDFPVVADWIARIDARPEIQKTKEVKASNSQ